MAWAKCSDRAEAKTLMERAAGVDHPTFQRLVGENGVTKSGTATIDEHAEGRTR